MPKFNRTFLFIIIALSVSLISFSTGNKPPKYQIRTIVIDPGHGGHDSGCNGASSHEKDVALAVSLKLGALIQKQFPSIKVIFTRKTDEFIELYERAAIANRNKADLFICIHCNSGPSAAFGAETFVMGLHKSESNLAVAKRENSSILLEKNYKSNYDGFDPNSPEANIIFSLYQNTFMSQSLLLATNVQDQFEKNGGRFNRGIKQAGFLVLFRTAMPSVLVELGFLTNKTEERYLTGDNGQDQLAGSLMKAFVKYKSETERKAGGRSNEIEDQPVDEKVVEKENDKESEIKETVKILDEKKEDTVPVLTPITAGTELVDTIPEKLKVFYTIQVGAIANAASADGARFNKIEEVRKIIGDDGMTRYFYGIYDSIDETRRNINLLKEKGFKDAFICAFSGAKRISVSEAGQLLKRK